MSISQLNANDRLRAAQAATALRSNAAYATSATKAPARQPDAVSLSDSARSLVSAQKTIASSTDVREDRVAAIKAAIKNGTYQVSSQELARSLVDQGLF